jgi:hypothetical protein
MDRRLYVPANVSTEREIWKGVTMFNGLIIVIVITIAAISAFILGQVTDLGTVKLVIGVIFCGFAAFCLLQKSDINLSPADYIRIKMKFSGQQKRFNYVYER